MTGQLPCDSEVEQEATSVVLTKLFMLQARILSRIFVTWYWAGVNYPLKNTVLILFEILGGYILMSDGGVVGIPRGNRCFVRVSRDATLSFNKTSG